MFPYETVTSELREHPEQFYRSYLCSGVTAVYDVGGHQWTLLLGTEAENSPAAPHFRAAGPLVTHAGIDILNTDEYSTFLPMSDEIEGRTSVRKLKDAGSTAVKVWYIKPSEERRETLDKVLMAVGDEARNQNLPLIIHATTLREAKVAIRAGASLLVHGVLDEAIDDEFIQMVLENDVTYTPTLVVTSNWMHALASVVLNTANQPDDPNDCVDPVTRQKIANVAAFAPYVSEQMSEDKARQWLAAIPGDLEFLKQELLKVYKAGVTIASGTDAGNPLTLHGPSIYNEMEVMQEAGIPPSDIIIMTTRNGAHAMGRLNDFGTLEPGMIADLLVLGGNPSVDVANFRKVEWVMRNGEIHTISDLSYANACSDSVNPEDVVQAQLLAYNAHDIRAFLACYAENATIHDLSRQQPVLQGRAAIEAAYAFLTQSPEEFGVEIIDRIVSGSVVVDTEHIVGLPTDQKIPDAVAVYEVLYGRIQNVWFPPSTIK